ncbi:MAG TPA: DUF1667 domain-containing protein [SAR202 cluster bacterium]|nr:DUF1667 domain-containing protein [SAR202 cluster bacterium]
MNEGNIVCTVCPTSCLIDAKWDEKELISIDRAQCKLAWGYISDEIFDPKRVVTTTVPTETGKNPLVSVKTAEPVPKHLVLDIMDTLAVVQAKGLVNAGDVIVADVLGTGVNIIATSNSD